MQHAFTWDGDRRIRYYFSGNPSKESIVLLHGWSMDASAYRRLAEKLSQHYYVIVPDLPGFGGSEPAPGPEVNYFADFLHDFLLEVNQHQTTIVGHSFGGAVGIVLAHRYPDKVKQLILLNSAGIPNNHALPVWGWLAFRKAVRNLRYPIGGWQVLRAFTRNLLRNPKWMGATFFVTTNCDITSVHYQITRTPVTVFWADRDDFYPSGDRLRNSTLGRYEVIRGTHDWPIVDPNLAATKICEVIKTKNAPRVH